MTVLIRDGGTTRVVSGPATSAAVEARLTAVEAGVADSATTDYVDDAVSEIGAQPPADASITLSKLAPSVRSALFAPSDLLGVRTLGADVVAVDAADPQLAGDLMVVMAESSSDANLLATGTVVPAEADIPAVVRLLEEGAVIDQVAVRAPWDAEPLRFTLHANRPGPISLGSVGYLDLDGGYAYTADDPSFHDDDYRLRWLVEPDVWANAEAGVYRVLFAQYVDPSQHGLVVRLDEAGDLFVQFAVAGTTLSPANLDVPAAEGPLWLEVSRRAATGVTSAAISEDGTTWVVVDSAVVEAGSTIHESTGHLMLGAFKVIPPATGGESPLTGKLYAFELATATAGGAWTTVADPDFRHVLSTGPVTDSYGNVWRVAQ